MEKKIGLWIDHREAIIVTLQNGREETRQISSEMEKHVRFSTGSHSNSTAGTQGSTAEDVRDRQFGDHLDIYYDGIVELIHDAESVFIFGPGEAKGELEARLKKADLGMRISGIEPADKMTIPQIIARVNDFFGVHRRESRINA